MDESVSRLAGGEYYGGRLRSNSVGSRPGALVRVGQENLT